MRGAIKAKQDVPTRRDGSAGSVELVVGVQPHFVQDLGRGARVCGDELPVQRGGVVDVHGGISKRVGVGGEAPRDGDVFCEREFDSRCSHNCVHRCLWVGNVPPALFLVHGTGSLVGVVVPRQHHVHIVALQCVFQLAPQMLCHHQITRVVGGAVHRAVHAHKQPWRDRTVHALKVLQKPPFLGRAVSQVMFRTQQHDMDHAVLKGVPKERVPRVRHAEALHGHHTALAVGIVLHVTPWRVVPLSRLLGCGGQGRVVRAGSHVVVLVVADGDHVGHARRDGLNHLKPKVPLPCVVLGVREVPDMQRKVRCTAAQRGWRLRDGIPRGTHAGAVIVRRVVPAAVTKLRGQALVTVHEEAHGLARAGSWRGEKRLLSAPARIGATPVKVLCGRE
mmetsp:Transcript_16813/g.42936  ORF Transcript_16813/g.42936 Transcript_16813/m.42936 type:complete len:391 (-) Transcript_16813:930-2102(-)